MIEVGKVKLREGVEFEKWRIEGRTVLHRSWSGITWRKKGSAMVYSAGCYFGPTPPPPPPPPPVTVVWRIRIYSDTAAGMSSMTIERMTENTYDIHSVEVAEAVGGVGLIYVIVDRLELGKDYCSVRKRLVEEFDGIILTEIIFDVVVPPFNGLDIRWGARFDEQTHQV